MFSSMKRLRGCTTSNLPIDLIFCILAKLPAKCLLRFRCVCKEWHNLIHTSTFIWMHSIAHKIDDTNYLIHDSARRDDSLEKDFFQWNKNCSSRTIHGSYDLTLNQKLDFSRFFPPGLSSYFLDFHGSCNGLVCLSIAPYTTSLSDDEAIFLWNPSINKLKALDYKYKNGRLPKIHMIGFGHCKGVVDDCKVVILSYDEDDGVFTKDKSIVVHVYTLSTNSWKRIDTTVHIYVGDNWNSSNSVNGALHWVGKKPNQQHVILSFDLRTEVLGEVMLPKVDSELKYEGGWHLGNFDGSLTLISYSSGIIFIWIMKEYGVVESWTKHVLDFGAQGYELICFGYQGCMMYEATSTGIFLIDICNKWTCLHNNLADRPNHSKYCAIDYNESLLLLNETS